jgi:hypothetical protein
MISNIGLVKGLRYGVTRCTLRLCANKTKQSSVAMYIVKR